MEAQRRGEYSTLEVWHPYVGLEVPYGNNPEATRLGHGLNAPEPVWSDQPTGKNAVVAEATRTPTAKSEIVPYLGITKTLCGMKPKIFIISAITIIVVVLAVVGGVVGGILSQKPTSSRADSSPPAASNSSPAGNPVDSDSSIISADSTIHALNWSDVGNTTQYNAVFWQDKSTNLAMSLWDSQNQTWALVNITENCEEFLFFFRVSALTPFL